MVHDLHGGIRWALLGETYTRDRFLEAPETHPRRASGSIANQTGATECIFWREKGFGAVWSQVRCWRGGKQPYEVSLDGPSVTTLLGGCVESGQRSWWRIISQETI